MAALMKERKFAPFFWTQFLGAFNDNVFKNALMILIAYKVSSEAEVGLLANLAAGLFILPFFLFSPFAGQLSDKLEKSKIIRLIKLAEVAIMILGGLSFLVGNIYMMIAVLFLMGTQSAFFGPVKYSILPQALEEDELMHGTGLVEMGTFVAILVGTIAGGVLIKTGEGWVAASVLVFAVLGYLASRKVPLAPAADPKLQLDWNPIRQFGELYRITKKTRSVFLSVMGISWFWLYGSVLLTQFPNFGKYFVQGDEYVVTLTLAIFTLSLAIGSALSNKLADSAIELALVPLGALGLSIFAFDLLWVDYKVFKVGEVTFNSFFSSQYAPSNWRILIDLALIGVSGSFYIVPLYALIQHRADPESCSRVIAGNNVANAIFMVAGAGITMALFARGLNTVEVFAVVAIMNMVVTFYIFALLPEFVLRFGAWVLARTVYRLRYEGRRHVPKTGAVIVVANHVSFVDWFILAAAVQRPIRFVMDHRIYRLPILNWIFRAGRCIPIAPAKEDLAVKEEAFQKISEALRNEEVIGLFPEGMITWDGELGPFKRGVETILEKDPVPVVPVALAGLWGSFFSRKDGAAMKKIPRPRRRKIHIEIGKPFENAPTAQAQEDWVKETLAKFEAENTSS